MQGEISAGRPAYGRREAPSAVTVARAAGVSAAAVSYVMNGKAGVSTETRAHILSVAKQLGYGQDLSQVAQFQRTRVIGLVFPNIINPMLPRWGQGVITAAAAANYEVYLATTQDDPQALANVTASFASHKVDGVIVAAALRKDATALRTLRTSKIPFVYLSRRSKFVDGDFVGIDDLAAGAQMMEHVLSHGYTDIATVVGPRFSTASFARERGFVQAAAAAGVEITQQRKISTHLNNDGGRGAAEKLFTGGDPPRAIVCGSDEIAIGVMEYAVDHGIRVPEDVAVTGFDGLPHSMSGLIRMTTMVQPQLEMATEAFAMLLKRMQTPSKTYQTLLCAHRLHVGRTCGCSA